MGLTKTLNLIGLALITLGALGAIRFAPEPKYNPDGSVYLVPPKKIGESDEAARQRRIRIFRYQKYGLPTCFGMIALGSILQALAAWAAC